MGQYHYLVNIQKSEFVDPHQIGDGLKLWEMAGHSLGGVATALVFLLACPKPRGGGDFGEGPYMGRWHGNAVAMVGDYAEPGDGTGLTKAGIESLWAEGHPGWKDITKPLRDAIASEFELRYTGTGWMKRESVAEEHDGTKLTIHGKPA